MEKAAMNDGIILKPAYQFKKRLLVCVIIKPVWFLEITLIRECVCTPSLVSQTFFAQVLIDMEIISTALRRSGTVHRAKTNKDHQVRGVAGNRW